MKKLLLFLPLLFLAISGYSQATVKLNGLYALGGVINPAIETTISNKVSYQAEIVYSPWKTIDFKGKSYHMNFGFLINECRYYFRSQQQGWYAAANFGLGVFDMSKPTILETGKFGFQSRYSKGWSLMLGVGGGYQTAISRDKRWTLDAYVGFGWMLSYYNGYSMDGQIDMNPHRPIQPQYPDPWNASGEWMPYKIGVSFGYRIIGHKSDR